MLGRLQLFNASNDTHLRTAVLSGDHKRAVWLTIALFAIVTFQQDVSAQAPKSTGEVAALPRRIGCEQDDPRPRLLEGVESRTLSSYPLTTSNLLLSNAKACS